MVPKVLLYNKLWWLALLQQVMSAIQTGNMPSTFEASARSHCVSTDSIVCQKFYTRYRLPNVFGDATQGDTTVRLNNALNNFTQRSDILTMFLCSLYTPPCLDDVQVSGSEGETFRQPLPCLAMCEMAEKEGRALFKEGFNNWPVKCLTLPTESCIHIAGPTSVAYVKNSIPAKTAKSHVNDFTRLAPPLEAEFGDNEDNYELEIVTLSDSKIPARRYDITDLGDPDYFQGWADVQGTGAANDYCRVVGKGKLRFLSCNLAGSSGQGHHYVSKLGFEAGHHNTWFMRDMDGDGRDDYCRCLISKVSSRITCMKAGERGFYGSTTQGGNQHTFSLPGSDGCHKRRFNHVFGE